MVCPEICGTSSESPGSLKSGRQPSLKVQIMDNLGRFMAKIVNGLSFLTGGIAALALVAAAIIITEGVVVRKLLGVSTIWQIEASVYLLMYACFVGAAFAQMQDHHLNVDLVIIHLHPRTREMTLIIVSILSCIICGVIAWYAWPMWYEAFVRNDHSESLWGPPLWIPYFFLPFGMSLLFLQYVVCIANKIKFLNKEAFSEGVTPSELKNVELRKADRK
jgi:TRAP-type C4-dicarboxylate transport system permease small subunit